MACSLMTRMAEPMPDALDSLWPDLDGFDVTRYPLDVAPLPEGIENRDYVDSWKAKP